MADRSYGTRYYIALRFSLEDTGLEESIDREHALMVQDNDLRPVAVAVCASKFEEIGLATSYQGATSVASRQCQCREQVLAHLRAF